MPQSTSHIRSLAEIDLHERVTLVGFVLAYSAMMSLVVSSTTPFLSENWASVWPITLGVGCVAALLIVGGLLVWPKASARVA
jgi:hypothetical protein